MEREIKFRGKQSSWIFGGYHYSEKYKTHYIINDEGTFEVLPESVGQFAGLKDKNGKDIYEGDVVGIESECNFGHVYFEDGRFILGLGYSDTAHIDASRCEVMGNVYENPDLWAKTN